jgi:2-keto-4-pentenoate hydratase/2-oxohepta-3-ene-1,7-dioic acid hydratase in catechol pathway
VATGDPLKGLKPTGTTVALAAVKLLAPIPRPPKIICVGLNYRDHAAEAKMQIPDVPTIFSKFPTSIIGPGDPIVLPRNSTRPGRRIAAAISRPPVTWGESTLLAPAQIGRAHV